MKRKSLAFFLAATMILQTSMPVYAQSLDTAIVQTAAAEEKEGIQCKEYLQEETQVNQKQYELDAEGLNFVKGLKSFSTTVSFKTSNTALQALAAINASDHTNNYISLYTSGGTRVGFEIRNYKGNTAVVNYHKYVDRADKNLADNKWHTITFVVTENDSYKVYLDQELILNQKESTTNFVGTDGWWEPTSVTFGGAKRISGNSYLFTGSLKNAKVYNGAISEDQVMKDHESSGGEEEPVYGEDVVKTEEYGIFDMGDFDSFNYRIPAMVTTSKGTVIASADQRIQHWSDWGNIDTVIRRSTDHGKTWDDPIDVIDLKSQPYCNGTQSAYTIDPVLIAEDEDGKNPGRVWMLVDMFPEAKSGSQGTWSAATPGTGYVEAEDGEKYLALYDDNNVLYTLRDEGKVYDADGNLTNYVVDTGSKEDAYHTKGDLYEDGEYVGNIYLKSTGKKNDSAPIRPFQTSYLWLTYSDDDGVTWSEPVDINGQVKADWMRFCGVGPGFGIQMKADTEYKGRLVFPIYYTIAGSGIGFQSSACVYSDDGGKTWTRGESPNDGRINNVGDPTDSRNPVGISELTESQIIELSNGHLLQFMRNTRGSGKVAVARSKDGGATWEDPVNTNATEVYCQLSVLNYGKSVDGKDRVLMSNPGGSGRNNGTLRIGEITETEESFTIDWTDTKMFCPGNYAYSCLTQMADGNVGLLYEHMNTIKFTSFNEAFIKDEVNLLNPVITSVTYDVQKETEHASALPGDTYLFTVHVNQNVTVTGSPRFRFMLNGKGYYADYVSGGNDDKAITFSYVVQEGDEGQIAFKGPKIVSDANGSVRNANGLSVSSGDMDVNLGYIGADPSDSSRDIPIDGMKATAGDAQAGEGAEKVIDNNTSTLWHTTWGGGVGRDDHWVMLDLGKDYLVDGFRYLPRQSGGTNGIITEYKVEVSTDGENFTQAATGEWAGNTSWKTVFFDAVRARYVRLSSLDAISGEAGNDYASAAEMRVTGVEAPEEIEEAEKEDLINLIGYAESQKNSDAYEFVVPAVKRAFEKAFADAKAVVDNVKATQTEVDTAYEKLLEMIHMLDFTGNSSSLKTLVDSASELQKEFYTSGSWNIFEEAFEAAKAVLADENALQDEINTAAEHLQTAMDGLVRNPVDKSKLQKLVDKSQKYVDAKEQYVSDTYKLFEDVLNDAKAVLENQDATQEEIDAAYAELQNAIFGLRLIPNKDKLEDLIKKAEKVDTAKYTAESAAAFKTALENAKAVFADENATEEEVKAAEKALQKAQKNLVAKASTDKKGSDKVASSDGKSKPAAKTGDAGQATVMMIMVLAGAAAVLSFRRKRR